jgi:hypothetical protein
MIPLVYDFERKGNVDASALHRPVLIFDIPGRRTDPFLGSFSRDFCT